MQVKKEEFVLTDFTILLEDRLKEMQKSRIN